MKKNFKSCIYIALVIILALALVGCGKKEAPATPWEWAQSLEEGDIKSVVFSCSAEYFAQLAEDNLTAELEDGEAINGAMQPVYTDVETELSDKQVEKLRMNLYRLEESNFTEYPEYAAFESQFTFKIIMKDGTEYYLSQSGSENGKLQMPYAEKVWAINAEKLDSFVDSVISDCISEGDDSSFATPSDMEIIEVTTGSDLETSGETFSTYGNLG